MLPPSVEQLPDRRDHNPPPRITIAYKTVHQTPSALHEGESLRRPVCLCCGGSMKSLQLATAPGSHPEEATQNTKDHDQHENNTSGKTEADPVHASITGNAGRFFTTFTSHDRRRVRQNRTDQGSEEKPHSVNVCYFERSRNPESNRGCTRIGTRIFSG
jgi:hypothetical protein